jgi:hypothetical protein
MMSLPLAISKIGDDFCPVAVLGLETGKNSLVDANGTWQGPYIPNTYRCFPFSLLENEGNRILCIDEDEASKEELSQQEPFFGSKDEPTETILGILKFLNANIDDHEKSLKLCNILDELGLFEPWRISYNINGQDTEVRGLYKINEMALNELSADKFTMLRDEGALILAYCQLLSMVNIHKLSYLTNNPGQLTDSKSGSDAFTDSGTISFDNL